MYRNTVLNYNMTKVIFPFLILFCILCIGCNNYKEVNGEKTIILNDTTLSTMKSILDQPINDSSQYHDLSIVIYNQNKTYLINKKDDWKMKFSDKYFDTEIKYADVKYVVVHCTISGIMNGLTIFPITHNDLFIIDRKTGKIIVDIQSPINHVTKTTIKKGVIYYEYDDESDRVRYLNLNK